jgi:trk system potassium uptake protein TrkH
MRDLSKYFLKSPIYVPILGFVLLITAGTLLLALPQASSAPGIGWINALFTATSASCVTGLVVVDTGTVFTPFGQVVILVLIQFGGLGIMTMSTLFLLIAGRRPSLAGRIAIQDTLTYGEERSLYALLRDVALFTFTIEAVGALLLLFRFLLDYDVPQALYMSAFHSVSAFCNAGFSLFSDSFAAYQGDWLFNLVICFLIVSGGIGFLVLSELKKRFSFNRQTWSRLSLHSKLVLTTTAILLITSSLLLVSMEWHNTLAHLSFPDRCLAGFFQAVSVRTAGFNSISIENMANETLFVLILLMFIGASPGSCGGGIKTTTVATLFVLGVSRLRGQERPQLFRRSISATSVGKAISIVMISTVVVLTATMLILMTELGEVAHPLSRGKFLELLFEVVSAFGTVGLSTGVTAGLTVAGKIILSFVMFAGRLGPLVIAIAVSRRRVARYYYADEPIMIG